MSFDEGLVLGLALGAKKNKSAETVTDPDYEFFKSLPEPEDNQTVWYIRTDDTNVTVQISAQCKTPADTAANFTIDWGDGVTETFSLIDTTIGEGYSGYTKNFSHVYIDAGNYTIICSIDNIERCPFWVGGGSFLIMAKYGSKIHIEKYRSQGFGAVGVFQYLQYLKIPSDTDISGEYFFRNLYAVRRIDFDKKFTEIPRHTFYGCYCLNFDNLDFSEVVTVGYGAFNSCNNLTTINLPACQTIGQQAFNYCYNLQNVSAPQCQTIDRSAFYYCYNLQNVSAPQCQTIGQQAFYSCYSVTKMQLPLCTNIGGSAFYNCQSLMTISAPMCTSAEDYAFQFCYNLRTAEFADGCTFGTNVFHNCYNLYPIPT